MHLHQTAETLFLVLRGVQHVASCLRGTRVHTEVSQLTDERIAHDLECQCGERLFVRSVTLCLSAIFQRSLDGRNIQRGRQVVHNGIQHHLHAFVLVRRSAQNREEVTGADCDAQHALDLFNRRLFAFQHHHHEVFIVICEVLDQLLTVLFAQILQIFRNFFDLDVRTQIVRIDLGLSLNDVNDSGEGGFRTDRQLDRAGLCAQTINDRTAGHQEVCTGRIHLVAEYDTGNTVSRRLTPYGLGLRLNASFCVQNGHGAIQYAQGTLDLNGEVDVSWCIDDVDAVTLPVCRRGSGSDRDTAFLLLCHPVHGGSTIVRLTHLVVDTGVVQNTLCRRRLTGIDMSHDTNIASFLK